MEAVAASARVTGSEYQHFTTDFNQLRADENSSGRPGPATRRCQTGVTEGAVPAGLRLRFAANAGLGWADFSIRLARDMSA